MAVARQLVVNHEVRSCFLTSRLPFQLQAFRLQERLYHVVCAGGVVVQINAMA